MHDGTYMLTSPPAMMTTLLYGIQPQGAGTADVESLFSVLLSMAYAHDLSPDTLVRTTLGRDPTISAALLPHDDEKREMRLLHGRGGGWGWGWDKDAGKTMIGTGNGALMWSHALELAAGVDDLRFTTLAALSAVISTTEQITAEQRICLACARSDAAAGRLPYGRLLWRMGCVSCCPTHMMRLVPATCLTGSVKLRRSMKRISHSGVCRGCGAPGFSCLADAQPTPATPAEVWRARQCADLVLNLRQLERTKPAAMKKAVRRHAESGDGGMQALARRSGAPKSILSRWLIMADARISLHQLLDISASEGLSLVSLVHGELVPVETPEVCRAPQRMKRKVDPVDHEQLRLAMKCALASRESPSSLVKSMHIDYSTLARHYDLDLPMKIKAAERLAESSWVQYERAVLEAQRVVDSLAEKGLPVTLANAGLVTGKKWFPSALRSKALLSLASISQDI